MKTCIICGMPLLTKKDYIFGDENKNYCIYCSNPDGSLISYEKKLNSMTIFLIRTQGLDEKIAKNICEKFLKSSTGWDINKK